MAGVALPVSKTVVVPASFTLQVAVAAMLLVAMALVPPALGQAPPPEPAAPAPATPSPQSPAAAPATPEAPPAATAVDYGGDRAAAYKAFREHFDARRFAEALPAAQQVLDITEQKYGKDAPETITPLMNLGTTKQRLADYNGAALQYQRALKQIESHQGGFSREIIQPLLGLGVSYAAAGDYDASARSLRRAMDVSRKLDGLFNPQQLELVEPLVASYVALGQYEEAVREQQYALRLAESTYGRGDPRLIPVLEHSAQWLETTGQYTSARQAYARALDIARRASKSDLRMVSPLRGIARMYRMEYLYGSGPVGDPEATPSPQGNSSVYSGPTPSSSPVTTVLNDAGEDALGLALEVLDNHPEEAVALRGETLVDLGDWYMISGRTRDAMREYKEAWVALSAPGAAGTKILDTPAQLIYRPPSSGRRNPTVDAEDYTEHFVETEFTVTPEGRAKDPKVVAEDVASEATGKSVLTSIKRSRYRPRFVDGGPVATSGVRHRQVIFVRSS